MDAYVTDKSTDMEIDTKGTYYMDEDAMVLMLREEGTRWEPPAIIEAITKLKNWAWEGAAHPMEDSAMKIKTVEPITSTKKIKTVKPITLAKNIVSIPIESVKNSFPYNMISDSTYLLALNVFISEIGKKTLNNKELKQGHVESIKEETQPVN